MHRPSLNKQPSFRDLTIGFPAKWRLTNDCSNPILMTDLGSAFDWLKQISFMLRPIRINTQIWVVKHFCSRFSDVISRGETSGCVAKCRLFSQANMALRLFLSISSDSCRIMILIRYPYSLQIKPLLVMHGINLNPLCIVDSWENSCSSSTLQSKLLFARLSLTCMGHPHNLRA